MPVTIISFQAVAGYEKITMLSPDLLAGNNMLQRYCLLPCLRKTWPGNALSPAHDLVYFSAKFADCLLRGVSLVGYGRFAG
ncbi:MAG: hypothetical protein A4E59_01693 [Syntrophorhabdus sp. PtaB.Bin027]|nr:MAG: hypothetical protein A4E59_01693 [Syntrophorhabdus sp. PtaB.Bin027]